MTQEIGRWCELNGEKEFSPEELEVGMDFRLPQYRRAVFMLFYEFHLKYRSHPGGVYYLMPYLAYHLDWNMEDKLWFAYINGCTQHPPTSFIIFQHFPSHEEDLQRLSDWFNRNWGRLGWDMDRRYQKKMFVDCVLDYHKHVMAVGTQETLFADQHFKGLWKLVRENFLSFGRLSTFSYLEYLRIMGMDFDCDDLFLEDMSGSKSHRNGLAKVLGRDDLDWHGDNVVKYAPGQIDWLKEEAALLLQEAKDRLWERPFQRDISYFTLESAFCTYKSWFRANRRYPNVYNDMLHLRLKDTEEKWPEEDLSIFHRARADNLPLNLIKSTPEERLDPVLQNHFRLTGQVVNMEGEWPCFKNDLVRR